MEKSSLVRLAPKSARAKGFSLVELLVAMTLSVILLAGVIEIYTGSKQAFYTQESLSRLQEGARFAIDRLSKEIGAAGYMGCLASAGNIVNTLSIQGGNYNIAAPITGTDATIGALNADTITISRATAAGAVPVSQPMAFPPTGPVTVDNTDADFASLQQYDVVTVSDCSDAATFMITNDLASVPGSNGQLQHVTGVTSPSGSPNEGQSNGSIDLTHVYGSDTGALASIYRMTSKTYSIATSAAGTAAGGTCAAATPGYCALFEQSLADPLPPGTELVEGVQSFNIQYGVDTDGDSAPNGAPQNAGAVANWNDVVSVVITLIVNEVEQAQGRNDGVVANPKTYVNTIRLRSRGA